MGQANERKRRLAALEFLSAGPADFRESECAYVLMSAIDDDGLGRLLVAARDLVPTHGLPALIESIRSQRERAAWVVVTYSPLGGTNFKLVRRGVGALQLAVDRVGEEMVARKLRWVALVFGSEDDVNHVRSGTARFQDRLPPLGAPPAVPVLGVITGPDPQLVLQIDRPTVEAEDYSAALLALDTFTVPNAMLDRVGGSLVWSFTGYDDDPRFLAEIPEVHLYLNMMFVLAPWAPVVTHPSNYLIWCKTLDERCVITTNDGVTSVKFPEEGANRILERLKMAAADLLVERLMVNEVHPQVATAMKSWTKFLVTGETEDDSALEDAVDAALHSQSAPPQNEKEFFESLIGAVSPGWVAKFVEGETPPLSATTAQDVTIYLLDTKTGWSLASGVALADMEKLGAISNSFGTPNPVPSVAISTIRTLAERSGQDADQAGSRAAIFASLTALWSTQIINTVQATSGSVAGHYLYMIYSPARGDAFARPSCLTPGNPGVVVSLEAVFRAAAEVIEIDISNPQGKVGGQVLECGGLQLCDVLQRFIDEL